MLCVFAAFAVVQVAQWAGGHRWSLVAASVLGLGFLALLVNSDAYDVRDERGANRDSYYLGQSYAVQGELSLAREAFRDAVEQEPGDADALSLLGEVEAAMGEPEAAAEHFVRALEVAPDYTTTAIKLVELHLTHGWPLDSASHLLQEALRRQPHSVSGFITLARVNLKQGDGAADAACDALYAALKAKGLEALYDDRDERAGAKFATMDLIGLPWRITVGPRGLAAGKVEVTSRRTGESEEMTPEAAIERIADIYAAH